MKKILGIVFIFLIIGFTNICYSAIIIIEKEDGRENINGTVTYKYVHVVSTPDRLEITCEDPGAEQCPNPFSTGYATPEEQQAYDYANEQIENNILTGQEDLPSGLTVKWEATSNTGSTSTIKIWETGQPEPTK